MLMGEKPPACAPWMTIRPIISGLDPVLGREAQGDGRDDGDRSRADRTHRGECGGQEEHDPRDGRHPPPHSAYGERDDPVDGAVVLRDREQVGDPHQSEEQLRRKARGDPRRSDRRPESR